MEINGKVILGFNVQPVGINHVHCPNSDKVVYNDIAVIVLQLNQRVLTIHRANYSYAGYLSEDPQEDG